MTLSRAFFDVESRSPFSTQGIWWLMAEWLTIVVPGRNYGPLGATLRMPCLVLERAGSETAIIEYPPTTDTTRDEIVSSSSAQISQLVSAMNPERVTFVAKSLGTAVLSATSWSPHGTTTVEAIWLTPLFGERSVRDGAIRRGWKSLLVAGDADPSHDPRGYEEVRRELDAESLLVPGADHGLEIPSDPEATLDALRRLTEVVRRFVSPS